MFKPLKNMLFRSSQKSSARRKSFQPMLECLEKRELMAANVVLVRPVTTNLTLNTALLQATVQSLQIKAATPTIKDAALVQSKAIPVKVDVATPAIKVDVSKLQNLKENINVFISESDLNALGLISRLPDAQAAAAAGNWMENFIFGDRGVQTAGRPGSSVGGVDLKAFGGGGHSGNPLDNQPPTWFSGRSGMVSEHEVRDGATVIAGTAALVKGAATPMTGTIVAKAATATGLIAGSFVVGYAAGTLVDKAYTALTGSSIGGDFYVWFTYDDHTRIPNPDASGGSNVHYITGKEFDAIVNRNDKTKEPTGEESSSSSSGPVNVVGNSRVGQWTSDMGGRVAAAPGDARGLRARMESRINIITK